MLSRYIYLWGAHASRSLHILVSKVLSSWGACPGEHCSLGSGGPLELLSRERVLGSKRKSAGAWAYIGALAGA
jgi:hypothetical protein